MDVIDHRAWSPRGINTTLVNEVYARAQLEIKADQTSEIALDVLLEDIRSALEKVIAQPHARIKVQRWFPGVVEEIIEQTDEKNTTHTTRTNVTQRLMKEASSALERKQLLQTAATKEKSVAELFGGGPAAEGEAAPTQETSVAALLAGGTPGGDVETGGAAGGEAKERKPRRRVRQKMRSTPVVGGGLFGETIEAKSGREAGGTRTSDISTGAARGNDMNWAFTSAPGIPAEITIQGEVYNIRLSQDTLEDLQKGFSGHMVDSRGIEISNVNIQASEDTPVVQRLSGFVRSQQLSRIKEEFIDTAPSETSEEITNTAV